MQLAASLRFQLISLLVAVCALQSATHAVTIGETDFFPQTLKAGNRENQPTYEQPLAARQVRMMHICGSARTVIASMASLWYLMRRNGPVIICRPV